MTNSVAVPPLELRLPAGATLILPAGLVADLEGAVRAWRGQQIEQRDLVAEIEDFLTLHPGTSTTEIARAIRARDHDVRSILRGGGRFQSVSAPAGRSGRLKAWMLAPTPAEAVPRDRTSGSRSDREPR
jgi:hypothetical protein